MNKQRIFVLGLSALGLSACATTTGITDPQECIEKYGIAAQFCFDEVEERNKEIEGEIQEINVDTSETQSRLDVLKTRQAALQQEYAELRSRLDAEVQNLNELRQTLSKLRANNRVSEAEHQALLLELDSVTSQVLAFQAKPAPSMPTQGDVEEIDEFLGTEVAMITASISDYGF